LVQKKKKTKKKKKKKGAWPMLSCRYKKSIKKIEKEKRKD
jgi:hypothetical protein